MRFQYLAAMAAIALFALGCDQPTGNKGEKGTATAHDHADGNEHDHDHGDGHDAAKGHDEDEHDHDAAEHDHPAHGPNGGHLFKLDSADYQGEWQKFKDTNLIKMHILDKDQKPALVKVDSFKVIPLTGNDLTPFELAAESPDAEGKTSVYSLDDLNLSIGIPLGVTIQIKIGDTVLKGQIDQHEPLDH